MKKKISGLARTGIDQRLWRIIAGLLCSSLLLLVCRPWSASAEDYKVLASFNRGLTYPTDVAVSGSGRIYVVDGVAGKVFFFNSGYQLTGSVSFLEKPTAVAVSGNTIFIADNATRSVKRFTESGVYAGELKKDGTTAKFKLPRNIAIDASGSIYVVDQFADSVEVFNAAGSYGYTISGLNMPQDAVAVGNELFIIDQLVQTVTVQNEYGQNQASELQLSRIRVFDLETRSFVNINLDIDGNGEVDEDKKLFANPGRDSAAGQFISLKGIAADSRNNIYLNDSFLNAIYKYNSSGSFAGLIEEPVIAPLGTTVSADGRLVVASSYEGAVKVIGIDAAAGAQSWLKIPLADAGEDQEVREGATFILDGSGSRDSASIALYQWTQTSGPIVLPENPYVTGSAFLTLTAPMVGPGGDEIEFELVVIDVHNLASAPSTTKVGVKNAITGSVLINNGAYYTTDPLVSLSLDAPEAVAIRFANDDEPFNTIFYTYMPEVQWVLSNGDGIKQVKVQFRDMDGNTSVATNIIVLDTVSPAAPEVIDSGTIPGDFDWNPVDGAVSYTLEYSFSSDFSVGTVTLTGLTFNGATISLDGLRVGIWYWRVRAVDAAGNTSTWSGGSFYVAPDCNEAQPETPLLSRPCNEINVSRTPVLETEEMSYLCGEHQRTKWQVSLVDDFSALVMDVGTTLDNLTAYRVPDLVLDPLTRYFWRVKQSADNGRDSVWSASCEFTTEDWPDIQGEDGVLYVRPEDDQTCTEEISVKEPIGDAGIRIKVIRVSSGVIARTIKELDPETITDEYSVEKPGDFPLGLLSFRLTVEPGAWAQVEITFSGPVPKDVGWYIYTAEKGWHAYTGAIFSRNRRSVILNFQDGDIDLGDTDGVANGVIVNP